jgi:hypothetical protein
MSELAEGEESRLRAPLIARARRRRPRRTCAHTSHVAARARTAVRSHVRQRHRRPEVFAHGWPRKGVLKTLLPRPLVGLGRRRFLRRTIGRGLLSQPSVGAGSRLPRRRRIEPRQGRAQRIKARRMGISIAFDDATDCRCHRGQLVVREVKCRHGAEPFAGLRAHAGHLVVSAAMKRAARRFLANAAPLFEKEGDALPHALALNGLSPSRLHRPCARP